MSINLIITIKISLEEPIHYQYHTWPCQHISSDNIIISDEKGYDPIDNKLFIDIVSSKTHKGINENNLDDVTLIIVTSLLTFVACYKVICNHQ